MVLIIFFLTLQTLASTYACWRGGAPERVVGVALALALAATILSPLAPGYTYKALNLPVLGIDVLLLALLVGVALTADRFWPMWLAALQLVTVGTHFVRGYDPDVFPIAYWWLTNFIGYPMLLVLAGGTFGHHARKARGFPEYGWTYQRAR